MILEYSGGNLARSLSHICRVLGARCTFFLSEAAPVELLTELARNGSEFHLVDRERGFLGVMESAAAFHVAHPHYVFLRQHENDSNRRIHHSTTGIEICRDLDASTGGKAGRGWVKLVGAVGTGGTVSGVTAALKKAYPRVQAYTVTPSELPYASDLAPNGLPKFGGSGGLGFGRKQRFIAEMEETVSGHLVVSHADSIAAVRLLRDLRGLRVGSSAGAAWLASMRVASVSSDGDTVVTTLACQGTESEFSGSMMSSAGDRAEAIGREFGLN